MSDTIRALRPAHNFVYDVHMNKHIDTIVAIATAKAPAGIGIVRLSGPLSKQIAETLLQKKITPRMASYGRFLDEKSEVIQSTYPSR